MIDIQNRPNPCAVCRHEYTSIHTETLSGKKIYICESCLDAAEYNFIFVCLHCGKAHVIHKMRLIRTVQDKNLKQAYIQCMDRQIIQGINRCVSCDPEKILHYMHPKALEC